MKLIVQKFGGTSVGSVERIRHVAKIIEREVRQGFQLVVVVSAMGHTTDKLLSLAGRISVQPSPREMDMLLTTGEQVTCALLCMALHQLGIEAVSLTGWQAGIITDHHHGDAKIIKINKAPILRHLEQGKVVVVAGFQGQTEDGEITTLGRGGSDITGVALAAVLSAERCDIYTDVKGVYTADPRVVPLARQMKEIDYNEMIVLAQLGAQVVHERAVQWAKKYHVPVCVKSSFDPVDQQSEGTWIRHIRHQEGRNRPVVHGLTHKILSDHQAKLSLVGDGIGHDSNVRMQVMKTLKHHQIEVEEDERGLFFQSYILAAAQVEHALQCLHQAFHLDEILQVNNDLMVKN
ncbi:aspartate kinase [Caldalkalibacillus thermarum TA2.A1]|uniref:Aspartokinase n=1 Tax=Caldalkalibacillus thermarum (strain TA2.A1) TaxID=986075 RepID=F5L4D3_CALTT|nr:aspartate kinase [Caldalkalibacillus thermarum]EGL83805.1 aspartate kinase [Caldalkalibacillus thermarum TA2.A1]QZT34826.1 aspartate kinase [Caldalkalibacillus thermarum TA2.A1]